MGARREEEDGCDTVTGSNEAVPRAPRMARRDVLAGEALWPGRALSAVPEIESRAGGGFVGGKV